jgi:hypothetical protein
LTFFFFFVVVVGLAETDIVVTYLATLQVNVDTTATATVVPKWASDRLPTQALLSGSPLPASLGSAFWFDDLSSGATRTQIRAVSGTNQLDAKYSVHNRILKTYTPGLGNLVVPSLSNDLLPPTVRRVMGLAGDMTMVLTPCKHAICRLNPNVTQLSHRVTRRLSLSILKKAKLNLSVGPPNQPLITSRFPVRLVFLHVLHLVSEKLTRLFLFFSFFNSQWLALGFAMRMVAP